MSPVAEGFGQNWPFQVHAEIFKGGKDFGKVVNLVKLAIPSHSGPFQGEEMGKVAHQVKWPF